MPLYELVCIAQRFKTGANALPLQALLKETSTYVHEAGGCVRRMDYHGLKGLPQRARKDGKWHDEGDLWTMWFDTNPKTLDNLHQKMRTDPRVLRWTTIRKGVTLPEVTAALPTSPHYTSGSAETLITTTTSLYSSNDKNPTTMAYPRPATTDLKLASKHSKGTTARAETEALKQQEEQGRREERNYA